MTKILIIKNNIIYANIRNNSVKDITIMLVIMMTIMILMIINQ